MPLWSDKYTPERVAAQALERLPRPVQWLMGALFLTVAWVSVINSTLSVLTDRAWVQDLGSWIYDHAGQLQLALQRIAALVHDVVALWRRFVHPILALLFGWLPFEVPPALKDLFVILLIYTSAWLRSIFVTRVGQAKALQQHASEIEKTLDLQEKAKDTLKRAERLWANERVRAAHLEQEEAGLHRNLQKLKDRKSDTDDHSLKADLGRQISNKKKNIKRNAENRAASAATTLRAEKQVEVTKAILSTIEETLEHLRTETPPGWVDIQRSGRAIRRKALFISLSLIGILAVDWVYVRALPYLPGL